MPVPQLGLLRFPEGQGFSFLELLGLVGKNANDQFLFLSG